VSKIDLFDCLSEMYLTWREQSYSLFENLKHNRVNNDIIQLVGEKYVWSVCCSVYKDNESLIGVDILGSEFSVYTRQSDCKRVLHIYIWNVCFQRREYPPMCQDKQGLSYKPSCWESKWRICI
jgi:hypothetical protein